MCTVKKIWRHDYISKAAIEKHNLIAAAYMELWLKENTKKFIMVRLQDGRVITNMEKNSILLEK